MNSSVFFIIWASVFLSHNYSAVCTRHNQTKYPAFIYKLGYSDIHFDGTKNVSWVTFCPAFTEREQKINDQVSITGRSLFLRNIHGPQDNDTGNICEKPLEPGMVYNSKDHQYEIGYELYYEESTFKWENGAHYENQPYSNEERKKFQLGADNYHVYKPVNNENQVINNDRNKEFMLRNDSSKLVFHWVPVLHFTSSRDNTQILMKPRDFGEHRKTVLSEELDKIVDTLRCKCEDCGLPRMDMKIYTSSEVDDNSKKSEDGALPSIEKLKPWNEQWYGPLELSQVIPLWYYDEHWAKTASCSHMNMIPVWKSIAEGQLRKVDLYILAVWRHLIEWNDDIRECVTTWAIQSVYFGASGVLTYKDKSEVNSSQQTKMYSSLSSSNFSQIIPIPKIIYRVIEAEYENVWHTATVVIHNDPNPITDSDRICDSSEEISGWEAITNDDPRTGVTYVCPYPIPRVVHEKLGFRTRQEMIKPLTLHSIQNYYNADLRNNDYYDATLAIDPEFENLLNLTAEDA